MTAIKDIEALLNQKYARSEQLFKEGNMRAAVDELYTEDIYYLTGDLRILRGKAELIEMLTAIQESIAEVHVEPVLTFGKPDNTGLVYQFCNTSRRLADGEIARAHYIAAFRKVGDDWLCEMEVPALGAIRELEA